MSDEMDLSEFQDVFFEECFEGLDIMENGLLDLTEENSDVEEINTIFRAAHSIKGGGGTFGFPEISEFTHVIETLLDQMRSGERKSTQGVVDLLLESVDCLRAMISSTQAGEDIDEARNTAMQERLTQALESPLDNKLEEVDQDNESDQAQEVLSEEEIESIAEEDVYADKDKSGGATTGGENTNSKSSLTFSEWDSEGSEPQKTQDAKKEVKTEKEQKESADVAPLATSPAKTKAAPQTKSNTKKATQEGGSIRVNIDKVDSLINLVGELVITQSMLSRFGSDFDLSMIEELREGLNQLARNTRELQENAMQIRMLPVSFAFSRFPRLVRDLSNSLGKKVELELRGAETEMDKTVLEKIGDPLLHLVRNSLDHGVETPEERKALGKSETAKVILSAYQEGGNIVLQIIDDGAGLNREVILRKAIEKGLVSENDELTDEQIDNLIFMPGFSTVDQVSEVSGRGVGMDVVRRNIKDLGGVVEVSSEPSVGSTFTIRLPLTLAILDGQLVRVGEEIYIISLLSIVESLQIRNELVNDVVGKVEMFRLRDEYIPIIRLHEVYGIETDTNKLEDGLLVVVEVDRRRVGIFVDELLGQQQVVIKSLETNFQPVEGLAGATILGDGKVALILDVPGLITRCVKQTDNTRLVA